MRLIEVHAVNRCRQEQRGFSAIELLIVIAIALIISAGAMIQFMPVLRSARAENALQTTLGQVRNARGLAIDQRAKYRISFLAPRTIQLDQIKTDPLGVQTITFVSSIALPTDTQFIAIAGIPTGGATPDALPTFGNAIDFSVDNGGGGTTLYFQPDGRILDAANRLNNGVVYVARPGELLSSRAVSVLGATGRVKGWHLIKNGANMVWTQ